MKYCSHCKKPYNNQSKYCTPACNLLAVKDRVALAKSYPHQPGHAMRDRELLADLLGARL